MTIFQTNIPSLDQFIQALKQVEAKPITCAVPFGTTLYDVLSYGGRQPWHRGMVHFTDMLHANPTSEGLAHVKTVLRHFICQARVEAAGGNLQVIHSLMTMMFALDTSLRHSASDTPASLWSIKLLARRLRLPEDSNIANTLKALCSEDAFALLQSRAANDYWRLNIFLEASSQHSADLPLLLSHMHMGLYMVRRKLQAPSPWIQYPPSQIESIISGAYLLAGKELKPNPLLLDEPDRHYTMRPVDIVPPGPYMTAAEVHAFGHGFKGYADKTAIADYPIFDVATGRLTRA